MGLVVLQVPPWSDLPTNGIESPADSASDSLDGGVSSASSAWLQRFVGGIWSSFISSSAWYGVYVAHKGVRYNANNATAANLADIFDIRLLSSYDSFASVGSNLSTSSRWTNVGYRMDRSITSHLTIGGRSANRSFHGKVASMVVTTLLNDSDMPTDNEIKTIVTDPMKWLQDFKIGNEYRIPSYYLPQASFGANGLDESTATQIWLMGDGTYDSYSNGIRGQVRPAEQNYTKLQLNSMVSNDIENVTISGLS